MAISEIRRMTTPEPMATLSWRSRCQANAQGLRPSIFAAAGRALVVALPALLEPFSNRH